MEGVRCSPARRERRALPCRRRRPHSGVWRALLLLRSCDTCGLAALFRPQLVASSPQHLPFLLLHGVARKTSLNCCALAGIRSQGRTFKRGDTPTKITFQHAFFSIIYPRPWLPRWRQLQHRPLLIGLTKVLIIRNVCVCFALLCKTKPRQMLSVPYLARLCRSRITQAGHKDFHGSIQCIVYGRGRSMVLCSF